MTYPKVIDKKDFIKLPSKESIKAQRHVSNIFSLSSALIHDLDFAHFSVLDDKNDLELYDAKRLLEILRKEAKETIKQIEKSLETRIERGIE